MAYATTLAHKRRESRASASDLFTSIVRIDPVLKSAVVASGADLLALEKPWLHSVIAPPAATADSNLAVYTVNDAVTPMVAVIGLLETGARLSAARSRYCMWQTHYAGHGLIEVLEQDDAHELHAKLSTIARERGLSLRFALGAVVE
jgi:ATP-dependent Clp protease adapter protein ClpS